MIIGYKTISRGILDLVSQGNTTFDEIIGKLGITRNELEFILELMEHRGYINKSGCDSQNSSCCPMVCSPLDSYSIYSRGVTYILTEKGFGACHNITKYHVQRGIQGIGHAVTES
ncbi:hypothetical protein SAMN04488587_0089 [Methanococcoides vulcani]|uniref:Transcriptional regulator HTH-type FeoC domain-containing protein n=1 Tax=Methanococcoides vulcani TaxID=1353158 RepID=A0A1H9Y0L6_9EURY|nr:hypothetical protein [Methanococcoides vulcani]SES62185.1 hypothetical protein SAMN04488587_0089 [Methanococcoides vulcani]